MLTNSLNNTANPGPGGAAAGQLPTRAAAGENAEMFTKLLVAQIRNQDPLSPSDPSQFVNQLSQLSQTEAMQNLAKLTGANASVLQSMQVLAMGAQVGSNVMVSTSQVRLDGHKVEGTFTLDTASAGVDMVLTGADGVAHAVALGARAAGTLPFSIDPAALGLAPGSYAIEVKTDGARLAPVEVAGRLDSVRMSPGGGIVLRVANVGEVEPGAVTAFNGTTASPAQAIASI